MVSVKEGIYDLKITAKIVERGIVTVIFCPEEKNKFLVTRWKQAIHARMSRAASTPQGLKPQGLQ